MRRKPGFAKLEHILNTFPQRVILMRLEELLLPTMQVYQDALQAGVPWNARLKAADGVLLMFSKMSEELKEKDKTFSVRWQRKDEGDSSPVPAALGPATNTRLEGKVEDTQVREKVGEGSVLCNGDDSKLPGVDVRYTVGESSPEDTNDGVGADIRGDSTTVVGTPGVCETPR